MSVNQRIQDLAVRDTLHWGDSDFTSHSPAWARRWMNPYKVVRALSGGALVLKSSGAWEFYKSAKKDYKAQAIAEGWV